MNKNNNCNRSGLEKDSNNDLIVCNKSIIEKIIMFAQVILKNGIVKT